MNTRQMIVLRETLLLMPRTILRSSRYHCVIVTLSIIMSIMPANPTFFIPFLENIELLPLWLHIIIRGIKIGIKRITQIKRTGCISLLWSFRNVCCVRSTDLNVDFKFV